MTLNVRLFPSDLLALDKGHLHSRVPQLLAGQVCFGEHDRESFGDVTLIVSFDIILMTLFRQDTCHALLSQLTASPSQPLHFTTLVYTIAVVLTVVSYVAAATHHPPALFLLRLFAPWRGFLWEIICPPV